MAKRDKGVTDRYSLPCTVIDDGVKVRYSFKRKDLKERFGPNYKDYISLKIGPELLERDMAAAERYLEYLSEHPESYGDGDKNAERELCGALMNLRVALGVGDRAIDRLVWAAATAGAQFGKRLEEMRVRLESTAVQLGRKNSAGRNEGYKTKAQKRRETDDLILALFERKKGSSEREKCLHTANELNRRYEAGDRKLERVLMQLNQKSFTPDMVRARVQRRKKESG